MDKQPSRKIIFTTINNVAFQQIIQFEMLLASTNKVNAQN